MKWGQKKEGCGMEARLTPNRTVRLRGLAVIALVAATVGCGAGDDDTASPFAAQTTTPSAASADTTAPAEADGPAATTGGTVTEAPEQSATTEPADADPTTPTSAPAGDSTDDAAACSTLSDEHRRTIADAAPESPAPGSLPDVTLPTDGDGVMAVFDLLPDDLIGGTKEIVARSPDRLTANYQPPELASQYGYQAMDLRTSFVGSILPEPRADMFIAFWVLSDDDDYVVEASGRDGDVYWVTFINTASGYGIEGVEELHTIAWGDSCQPWGFTAAAPTPEGRDELIAAFVAATSAAEG
jgi:hypothetical protein